MVTRPAVGKADKGSTNSTNGTGHSTEDTIIKCAHNVCGGSMFGLAILQSGLGGGNH